MPIDRKREDAKEVSVGWRVLLAQNPRTGHYYVAGFKLGQ